MASQELINVIHGYEDFVRSRGVDEGLIDAYVLACSAAFNEGDARYALQISERVKEIINQFTTTIPTIEFEQNKSYKFNLVLGLSTVEYKILIEKMRKGATRTVSIKQN